MTSYSVEGLPYERGVKLIEALKAQDIQANITVGGIQIVPLTQYQANKMWRICEDFGATPHEGTTFAQNTALDRAKGVVFKTKGEKPATPPKNTIEVYYDPKGIRDGKMGCMRARLKNNPKIHAAGIDEKSAIKDLLLTLGSIGYSPSEDDYDVVPISAYVLLSAEKTTCYNCQKPVYLLANTEEQGKPAFYICFGCKIIGEVGVGSVKIKVA